jgi:stearoyl-CoA desaturase (delta-9 desaturase)
LKNWYKHINWLNVTLIIVIPVMGCTAAVFTPLNVKTAVLALLYYAMTGMGITAGYHRLWSHRAYSARLPLRIFLAAFGGGAVEGSIRWWSCGHRLHHRYTDTDKDPYSVRKGLLYSHIGWMVLRSNPKKAGRVDIADLNADPVVRWQHKNYILVLFTMAYLFPMAIAGFGWGDWKGGLVWAGIVRLTVVHHATFCVNSLAHYLGDQPFDDRRSPRDHFLTALVTFGEGYHNFHHEFPSDYRNAIRWYQYDPTKWLIWVSKKVGLAYDLKTFSQNAIEQGIVQQRQKKLDRWRSRLNWGVPLEQLPVVEFEDFQEQAKTRALVVIAGVIHDVENFIEQHPGGKALISSGIGKDATAVFNGGVYDHSNAAHNLLGTMRVGVIRGGSEVEVWKTAQRENKDATIMSDSNNAAILRAGLQATRVQVPVMSAGAA